MEKKFTLDMLVEDIRTRNVGTEGKRLLEKWNRTGLLRGLAGTRKENMARLLENQAAELLREASSLSTGGGALASSGDIRGFSNIAFPMVRRVFGGLVANELVSIQPMSLPSGLLFYLDYTYGTNTGGAATDAGNAYAAGQSIYNNPRGKGIRSGSLATGGQYDIVGSGYTKVHTTAQTVALSGTMGSFDSSNNFVSGTVVSSTSMFTGSNARFADYDVQIEKELDTGDLAAFCFCHVLFSSIQGSTQGAKIELLSPEQITLTTLSLAGSSTAWGEAYQGGNGVLNLRRLNKRGTLASNKFTPDALNGTHIQMAFKLTSATNIPGGAANTATLTGVVSDTLNVDSTDASALTIPSFESDFGATPSPAIPEIDIKVESIPVTATTRKLRAKWSPELAQDLNAYHSLDAEVELTQILSETIALEIDREILGDLLRQANGANFFWSRAPGKFVNKQTGTEKLTSNSLAPGPQFFGNVQEWYQTLVETIIDVANTIHRKTLRGAANFIVTSPDVCTILEASQFYKNNISVDGNGQTSSTFNIGAEPVGKLSNRFTVYKDPYFPRNKILIGYKGGSYLETGYVYAPYVPLIITPTIFAPEDFTPRKGVMTRYGKKMVRSDFYGTVTVLDMNII